MTESGNEPEGFTPLTDEELQREAQQAISRDTGQKNSTADSDGYLVQEETRRIGNYSIQGVAYSIDGVTHRATLASTAGSRLNMLIATSDGRVFLSTGDRESDAPKTIYDITDELAAAGITAAGIRRTQYDIAADGEVDRTEQEKIKGLINRAIGALSSGERLLRA